MAHGQQLVHLSFTGQADGTPTLIDLTFEVDTPEMLDLEAFIRSTFDTDPVPVRTTLDIPKLNACAPVQVFRRSMLRDTHDDKGCVICVTDFRPRMHVRRLPCGHMVCARCIAKWAVQQSDTCPTCRHPI